MNEVMAEAAVLSAMQRKAGAGRDPLASPVPTAGRAWYVSMPRIADDHLGLEMSVLSVRESEEPPEAVLAGVVPTMLLLKFGAGERAGLAILDSQLLSALIEIQMVGVVGRTAPPERRPTPTDAAITSGVVDAWCAGFDDEVADLPRPPVWVGARTAGMFAEVRAALMALPPTPLRVARLTLDLGDGARQGTLTLAIAADVPATASAGHADGMSLGEALRPRILTCPAVLTAVLARPTASYEDIVSFAVGDLVPIPVEALSEVSVEDANQRIVARARLGQVNGNRALRLDMSGDKTGRPEKPARSTGRSLPAPPGMSRDDPLDIGALPDIPDLPDLPDAHGAGDDAGQPDGLPDLAALPMGGLPDLPE